MYVFLLLKPKLLSLKNTFSPHRAFKRGSQRELVFFLASLTLIIFVYQASFSTFSTIHKTPHLYQLQPEIPISLFFSLLSGMIFLSGSAAALGAFYLGHDLDLLFSKPITPLQFLIGKGCEVIMQSSWMILVFGLPALAGIGRAYGAPLSFNFVALAAILPVLAIPTLVGITLISLVVHYVPPKKMREFLFIAASIMILYIYLTAKNFLIDPATSKPEQISASLQQLINLSSSSLLPSAWAAQIVGHFLRTPTLSQPLIVGFIVLYSISALIGFLAYTALSVLHAGTFSKVHSNSMHGKIASSHTHLLTSRVLFFISPHARALWSKEIKLFCRDLTQGLQLIMLLGICLVYLYNFRVVHRVGNLSAEMLIWWRGALLLCNIAMGSFIITAVSSRFVFPSISLEGNAFWIMRTAPLTLRSILNTKFWVWYPPIACISTIILVSGALAIDASPLTVALTGVLGLVVCYGLIGLAVGLGCLFANFDWENTPQMSSSFGNFIFMLAGTLLIFVNSIPIFILIVLATIRQTTILFADSHWYVAVTSIALIIIYINYATHRFSLRIGEEALLKKS